MPKYIVLNPVKIGPPGDGKIRMPGEELILSQGEAAPLLEKGTIKKPRLASAYDKLFGNKRAVSMTVTGAAEDGS